ncbi:hypothetical protein [Leptospira ilyithenensis]|nr:hypothetical protein [Leptospira ilyithenensis]
MKKISVYAGLLMAIMLATTNLSAKCYGYKSLRQWRFVCRSQKSR